MQTDHNIIPALIGFLIFIIFYFAPTLNARSRKHPSYAAIFLVNLLLGWTMIGWLVAIMWSASDFKFSGRAFSGITPHMKYSQLESLASMKERGFITDEEFEMEKKKLLDS
ncbi:superinfection immunity protein [Pseudomonas petrae]|uniref:Superinfection immunity protein n=1 Tax=Pseudomonas petrae TaxID=2912190 RepID=A0ABS9I266_9PSED|nr:superinfection immunity protein [Pseudomonas petrae]MCF7531098.1 superinfection immunity protein [Pseudomonas petrae]MCF7536774.1 superinfection immunity protein [Pseudomonas petrae]MCF7541903.1 superinfection immunity protein [Pseudomonas petrae]MCF7554453.1 superinfection immunity protein [Pseudomonas petrae]